MLNLVKAKSENVYVYKAKMIIMKWKDMKDMSQVQPMTNSWSYYGLRLRHPKPEIFINYYVNDNRSGYE
jgi:hypothetical protein